MRAKSVSVMRQETSVLTMDDQSVTDVERLGISSDFVLKHLVINDFGRKRLLPVSVTKKISFMCCERCESEPQISKRFAR